MSTEKLPCWRCLPCNLRQRRSSGIRQTWQRRFPFWTLPRLMGRDILQGDLTWTKLIKRSCHAICVLCFPPTWLMACWKHERKVFSVRWNGLGHTFQKIYNIPWFTKIWKCSWNTKRPTTRLTRVGAGDAYASKKTTFCAYELIALFIAKICIFTFLSSCQRSELPVFKTVWECLIVESSSSTLLSLLIVASWL